MSKNNYSAAMRRMREFRSAVKDNFTATGKEISRLEDLKSKDEITKTVFDREVDAINAKSTAKRKELIEGAKKDLIPLFDEMKTTAKHQVIKAPTSEIAATLQILGTLDRVTPKQIELYAEQMQDCPLAMQRLSQIASMHDLRLSVEDPETRFDQLALLESNFAAFLGGYTGDPATLSATVLGMEQYFRPEEQFMGNNRNLVNTDSVNRAFWNTFVGSGSPDFFDDPSTPTGKPKAQYFFGDLDGLRSFIDRATSGVEGSMKETITAEILKDCPEKYGAAYRHFLANGEKMDINAKDER